MNTEHTIELRPGLSVTVRFDLDAIQRQEPFATYKWTAKPTPEDFAPYRAWLMPLVQACVDSQSERVVFGFSPTELYTITPGKPVELIAMAQVINALKGFAQHKKRQERNKAKSARTAARMKGWK